MANKKEKTPVKKAVKKAVEIVPSENLPARIDVNPQALVETAIKQGAGIEIIQQLLDVRERLQKEAAQIAFREAMAEFQRECPVIVKSTGVDYTSKKTGARVKYQYASLDVIVASVRDILSRHGFSYTFTTTQTDKSITAECHVHHVAGHTETTTFTLPFDDASKMNAMQTVASSLTYAKRYAFCNGFGIMTGEQDNDANNHIGAGTTTPETTPKTTPVDVPDDALYEEALSYIEAAADGRQLEAARRKYREQPWNDGQRDGLTKAYNARLKDLAEKVGA